MSRAYESAKREHAGEPITFTLDGELFTCQGDVTILDISEYARHADLDADATGAAAVVAEFFANALGAVEYRRFRRHVREHGTSNDTIIAIMQGIIEDVYGRPTERSSGLPDGPSTTGRISKVVSLSRGEVRVIEGGAEAAS